MTLRQSIIAMLKFFPGLKRILRRVYKTLLYTNLHSEEIDSEGIRLRNSWQDVALPKRQRELVDLQLQQYRSGTHIEVFDILVDSLRTLPKMSAGMSLLEIGCSSGYYAEVLQIAQLPLEYFGCDYSKAFVHLARNKYPDLDFQVKDATDLGYPDCSFDIVVSGCCLLHIPEYVKAIKETARVAISYCIFHRTPIVWGQPEQWYRKQAYGFETIEIHFNESQFLENLEQAGLEVIFTYTLGEDNLDVDRTRGSAVRTYVCRKKVK